MHFMNRCGIIRKKGINIAAFLRNEINNCNWIETHSYFALSDLLTVILFCQLDVMKGIQNKKFAIWNIYNKNHNLLEQSEKCLLPFIPDYSTKNIHICYLVCKYLEAMNNLIDYLGKNNIQSAFHNLLHIKSQYFKAKHDGGELKNSDHYSDCLVRLLLFYRRNR